MLGLSRGLRGFIHRVFDIGALYIGLLYIAAVYIYRVLHIGSLYIGSLYIGLFMNRGSIYRPPTI